MKQLVCRALMCAATTVLIAMTPISAQFAPTYAASYPDGTILHATDTGSDYRVAGGAPLHITDCSPFGGTISGGCAGAISVTTVVIGSMSAYPKDGTRLHAADTGNDYVVAGGAPLHITNCTPFGGTSGGGCNGFGVNQATIDQLDHLRPVPFDGTFLHTDTGTDYRVAGGAPIHITNCYWFGGTSNGGCTPSVLVNQATVDQLDHLFPYPMDGTFLHSRDNGTDYRVVGGAPLHITNCTNVGNGCSTAVNVNQASIDQLDHLQAVPVDGSRIHTDNGTDYVTVGGAPIHITDCTPYGGTTQGQCKNTVLVNQDTVNQLDHLNSVPSDGSFMQSAEKGGIYIFSGGVPNKVTMCSPSPCAKFTLVNQAAIDQQDHMAGPVVYPSYIQPNSGTVWHEIDWIYNYCAPTPVVTAVICGVYQERLEADYEYSGTRVQMLFPPSASQTGGQGIWTVTGHASCGQSGSMFGCQFLLHFKSNLSLLAFGFGLSPTEFDGGVKFLIRASDGARIHYKQW